MKWRGCAGAAPTQFFPKPTKSNQSNPEQPGPTSLSRQPLSRQPLSRQLFREIEGPRRVCACQTKPNKSEQILTHPNKPQQILTHINKFYQIASNLTRAHTHAHTQTSTYTQKPTCHPHVCAGFEPTRARQTKPN